MARTAEFYYPLGQSIRDMTKQLQWQSERSRRLKADYQDAQMKRVAMEYQINDPAEKLRRSQAAYMMQQGSTRSLTPPGSQWEGEATLRSEFTKSAEQILGIEGVTINEQWQLEDTKTNKLITNMPRWRREQAEQDILEWQVINNTPSFILQGQVEDIDKQIKQGQLKVDQGKGRPEFVTRLKSQKKMFEDQLKNPVHTEASQRATLRAIDMSLRRLASYSNPNTSFISILETQRAGIVKQLLKTQGTGQGQLKRFRNKITGQIDYLSVNKQTGAVNVSDPENWDPYIQGRTGISTQISIAKSYLQLRKDQAMMTRGINFLREKEAAGKSIFDDKMREQMKESGMSSEMLEVISRSVDFQSAIKALETHINRVQDTIQTTDALRIQGLKEQKERGRREKAEAKAKELPDALKFIKIDGQSIDEGYVQFLMKENDFTREEVIKQLLVKYGKH